MKTKHKIASIATLTAISILLFAITVPIAYHYFFTLYVNEHSNINDGLKSGGTVYVWKNNVYVGSWKFEGAFKNNMTDSGKDDINDRLFNASWTGGVWKYIAIGTGTDDGDPHNNTALITEIDREIATYWKPAAGQWGLNYTFSFASSYTIKEAGILNNNSGGSLAFYVGDLNVAVTSSDTLKISWQGTTSGN